MKHKINSSKNMFTKINIKQKLNTLKTENLVKNNLILLPTFRKIKSLNKNSDHSYIPKPQILKILVSHQNKKTTKDDKNELVIPLRNKICEYQTKNEMISEEINKLRKETKPFLNRYHMSGLLTPKSNFHYIKLGISKNIIKDINSEGYNLTDVLNKANIFDKSLLLNKKYANFARSIIEETNPELINDSNYISKMNETLYEKRYNDLFKHNDNLMNKTINKRKGSLINKIENKDENDKKTKVSVLQLINEFNIINKDIKMIRTKKIFSEIKKRRLKHKDLLNNAIKNANSLNSLEETKTHKNSDKKYSSNKTDNKTKLSRILTPKSLAFKRPNNNLEQKMNITNNINMFPLPNLEIIKRKSVYNNRIPSLINMDSLNNSLRKSYDLSSLFPKDENQYKNKRNNFYSFKKDNTNNLENNNVNRNKSVNYLSLEEMNNNPINRTEDYKSELNTEKRKIKLEEYKKNKNESLQKLYNNIKIKSFKENRNDISEYLRKYKGASIKEPDYEKGSKIYNIINDFVKKSSSYNLPNEINKIRFRTNMYGYKKTRKYDEIVKLNNKVQNLIYDYAEDILDLNNDLKK